MNVYHKLFIGRSNSVTEIQECKDTPGVPCQKHKGSCSTNDKNLADYLRDHCPKTCGTTCGNEF